MSDTTAKNVKTDGAAIELADVQVSYMDDPELVLIQDVNWRIGVGDFWVVSGRPVSGKSALLMSAGGLNRPVRGTLRILGQDVAEAHEKDRVNWRRRIGYVFEHSGRLFGLLNVAQNIALPMQYHPGMDEAAIAARVDELLTMTGLQDYAGQMPSHLNLSIQQRVGLARALALSVEVLFLDNPLSTLSLRECRWWLDFLRQLQESHRAKGKPLTLVASADDFRGWSAVAGQFAVVEGGRFHAVGGRAELSASAEPVVQEFMAKGF
jgi:ABC-type transporter Mla maintaining outer membrane lipid asymmetry ATPase subunit MlaF